MAAKPMTIAAGIDAGANATRCVIGTLENGRLRYLGHGLQPARGWTKGRVADPQAIAESIRYALLQAESDAFVSVQGAVLGLGGSGIDGGSARGLYEFGRPHTIDHRDLVYAIEKAMQVRLENDRIVLQVAPQDFTIDGRAGFRNPRGMTASRLEANVHIVTASEQEHQCLVDAMHAAHLAVEETIFEAIASAYAAVTSEERAQGVAVLDIGSHSTDLAIYGGEALLAATSIPIGGEHFTRDVAWCLTVPHEDAERMKIEYGCAMVGLTSDASLIELPSPEGRGPREAPRRKLNEILEARAEELFLYVREEFERCGVQGALSEGVVLTGGAAMLPGLCDMAERVLNCAARNGLPTGIAGWPEEILDPSWTAAAGLAMYSARLKFREDPSRTAPGLLGLVFR